jgi:signal transduction histidine kinase
MAALDLLETIVFPWLLFDPAGKLVHKKTEGLFPIPSEANHEKCRDHYTRAIPGWSICPMGFSVYCIKLDDNRLVFPGLRILNHAKFRGKSDERSIWITQDEFVSYIGRSFARVNKIEIDTKNIISANLHDIRRISTDIYEAAQKLIEQIGAPANRPERLFVEISKNITALSDVLHNRIQFMDYISNPTLELSARTRIKVYSKFHKIWKSMKPSAGTNDVELRLLGQSDSFTEGVLNIFELIPYLMVDNAIKYSPPEEEVLIHVTDSEDQIIARVSNWGPKLDDGEIDKVFFPGFRGRLAIASGKSGSGIGLSTLSRLVREIHRGTISLVQDNKSEIRTINGLNYMLTHIDVTFRRLR